MAISVILYAGYFYYSFNTAPARMKQVCSAIQPGMSFDNLESVRAAHGLSHPLKIADGTIFMAETRTMGRYSCRVDMESGKVKAVTVQFFD